MHDPVCRDLGAIEKRLREVFDRAAGGAIRGLLTWTLLRCPILSSGPGFREVLRINVFNSFSSLFKSFHSLFSCKTCKSPFALFSVGCFPEDLMAPGCAGLQPPMPAEPVPRSSALPVLAAWCLVLVALKRGSAPLLVQRRAALANRTIGERGFRVFVKRGNASLAVTNSTAVAHTLEDWKGVSEGEVAL